MANPRILFLSPRLPYPLNTGTKIRISHILQSLTQVARVDLVTYGDEQDLEDLKRSSCTYPGFWSYLNSIQFISSPPWPEIEPDNYIRKISKSLFDGYGIIYSSFPMELMRERITPLLRRADLIWTERLYLATRLNEFCQKIVVDIDDLESVKIRRHASRQTNFYLRRMMIRESNRLERTEKNSVERFLRLAVCSDEDRNLLGGVDDRLWVIPNGVGDDLMLKKEVHRDASKIIFVGTMYYEPNQDAVLYFCRDIFPIIKASIPDATFYIVGLKPPSVVTALHDGRDIFVCPDVPDVSPYVGSAAVSIVPLRIGGGTRLKILESLAYGTPVVSTTIGAEGLDLQHDQHLMLADTPDDFAYAVIKILRDSGFRNHLAATGKEQVRRKYLWSTIRDRLATDCQNLLQSNRENN